MAEKFLSLSREEQLEALGVAATASGRPEHLLEKDVWVVWALSVLFESKFGDHLVFKGGTSLSKAYNVIRRFSEDVDVTYDIRELAADLVKDAEEALPENRSQESKWTKAIRQRLPAWLAEQVLPIFQAKLDSDGISAKAVADGVCIRVLYDPLAKGSGYVKPEVMIEFGARSTGEPCDVKPVVCDAAEYLKDLEFPTASPRVMRAERTFWEKATAVHVYCLQRRVRGERFARHWHDLTRLDAAGYATTAFADRELAAAVARHKTLFFSEKDAEGLVIDYMVAVSGGLHLVPDGEALAALEADYQKMVDDNVLLDDAEPFSEVIERCRAIESQANVKRLT